MERSTVAAAIGYGAVDLHGRPSPPLSDMERSTFMVDRRGLATRRV
jgi:hypothetical protein